MRGKNRWTGMVVGVVMGVLFPAAVVLAGGLEPSVGPSAADSQMYTLEQIYNRINNGAAATKTTIFTEPSSGPTAGTMHTLDEIYALAGLRAPVPRTGQTPTVPELALTGSDGDLKKGVTWPNPRFIDNGNGTVTDNLTGLIWLKDANCFGLKTWLDALTVAIGLKSGGCSLTDGSTAGDWRLPNVKELLSLIDWAFSNPPLSNAVGTAKWTTGDAFTGVQPYHYWTSTPIADNTHYAWVVYLPLGNVVDYLKTNTAYVWPVRAGQ